MRLPWSTLWPTIYIFLHFIPLYLSFQWNTWSEILGAQTGSKPAAGAYIVKYLLYVLWAVLFAMLASLFVHSFAPYAWFLVVVYTVKHYCFTFFQQVIFLSVQVYL
jgi:hypothetical protein